jgi:hypothetical protein
MERTDKHHEAADRGRPYLGKNALDENAVTTPQITAVALHRGEQIA